MVLTFVVVGLFPLTALIGLKRRGWNREEAARIGALTAVAWFISAPLLSDRGLGTGEAYNYSLAVADTVSQMRAGVVPVYVGQSEYAFNGRVHPLRTAPYFTHFAGLLDLLTFRQLSFWGLQNLTLAVSLFGAVFSAYACLRRLGKNGPPAWVATALAASYGLSPGLLAPAYGLELYMTVAAAPFLPIAVLGALRSFEDRSFSNYAMMSIGLAAAWWAHAPIALWMSTGCGILVAVSWLTRRPRGRALLSLSAAALLGAALVAYVVTSSLTLGDKAFPEESPELSAQMVATITDNTATVGWKALLPLRHAGTQLGDFQLGYAAWLLLATAVWAALRERRGSLWAMLAAILFFIILTLPIPWLHRATWTALPSTFAMLTNAWPMQRAYLVLAIFVVFAFALGWSAATASMIWRRQKLWGTISVGVVMAWTVWQAWPFMSRALFEVRKTAAESTRDHLPANVNLTVISYAFVGVPERFTHGARDPAQELRLLSPALDSVLLDNATTGRADSPPAGGTFRIKERKGGRFELEPKLLLEPGTKYRLTFDFIGSKLAARLRFEGATVQREYVLPNYAGKQGFGMEPENSRTLVLWTDAAAREEVSLILLPQTPAAIEWEDFARYTLTSIEESRLPIQLVRLVPWFECTVDAPSAGWLETPRMHIPGYEARVNGERVPHRRSPSGTVVVPVSPGKHVVELRYRGTPALTTAFTVSALAWCVVLGFVGIRIAAPAVVEKGREIGDRLGDNVVIRRIGWLTGAVAIAVSGTFGLRVLAIHRSASAAEGPLELDVAFPIDRIGHAEPLLSMGSGPGSTLVFARYLDGRTFQLGVDVWDAGSLVSEPIPLDYLPSHKLRITTGALYRGKGFDANGLSPQQLAWLRDTTRITLDDREVLFGRSPPSEQLERPVILTNVTGSRSFAPRFTGEVLDHRWLSAEAAGCPFPSDAMLTAAAGPVRLRLKLPADAIEQCEPLLAIGPPKSGFYLFAHYVDSQHVRLGWEGGGLPFAQTEPIAIDYSHPHELVLSAPPLYPDHNPAVSALPSVQRAAIGNRLTLDFNGKRVLFAAYPAQVKAALPPLLFGRNEGHGTYAKDKFSGRFLGIDRVPQADWPSSSLQAVNSADAVGPIELTVRLPSDMIGRAQPLLTTGKAGAGTFVFIRYLDAGHIQIGADVWGVGLYRSEPIAVNYSEPLTFVISSSALHPLDHPAVRGLGPSRAEALRKRLLVQLGGRTVLDEPVFCYDAAPEEITVGGSLIGGSYTDPIFTGEIIATKRRPIPSP